MSSHNGHDLIIIGGGASGLAAGIYAKRAALDVVLIEKGAVGGQMNMTDDVENYPGFPRINGAEISSRMLEHADSLSLDIIYDEVVEIEPGLDVHTVKLTDGRELPTCSIILATGGQPKMLEIPGEQENYGKGVSYCGVCDGFFFRNKTILVVGGGDTAAEEALYLAKLADKVYMAHRRDELRASKILQKRIFDDCKIEMLWNTITMEIYSENGAVSGVALQNNATGENSELAVDGVFIFIGFIPRNELAPAGVKMTAEGYIVTDEKCETNIPGIFAVGDLREKYARQIVISAADGSTAALAAAHFVEAKKATGDGVCEAPAHLLQEE